MSTRHDRAVLNSIFNPLLPVGECVYDEELAEEDRGEEEEEWTPCIDEAKQLEIEGVKAAEAGEIEKSIDIFTKAIEVAPQHCSGYNNRAQALRLKGDNTGALDDLNNAINIGRDKGRAVCQAYCQRGLLHRLMGQNDRALEDFKRAADLGSEFAKAQVVQMNPYAALCNQMLNRMINQLQTSHME